MEIKLMREMNLSNTDLSGTDLIDANMVGVDLHGAKLQKANLRFANLTGADLVNADFSGACLENANLKNAVIANTNFTDANLMGADYYPLQCPEKGAFTAFVKDAGYIVELEVLADAKRSSATSRLCRCSAAKTISITNPDGTDTDVEAIIRQDGMTFKVGEIVSVENFDDNRWNEWGAGIRFYITRGEALFG